MLQGTSLGEMFGHNLQYLLKGIVLMSVLGSTLMERGLLPWLVIICNVVWKEVCLLNVISMMRLHSLWLDQDLMIESDLSDACRGLSFFCWDEVGICTSRIS